MHGHYTVYVVLVTCIYLTLALTGRCGQYFIPTCWERSSGVVLTLGDEVWLTTLPRLILPSCHYPCRLEVFPAREREREREGGGRERGRKERRRDREGEREEGGREGEEEGRERGPEGGEGGGRGR